jgi:4-amino-4-deoxy-L-arabinose transferase-like glycosyltransferase
MKKIHYFLVIALALCAFIFVNYQVLMHSQVARINDEGGRIYSGFRFYDLLFKNSTVSAMKKLDRLSTLSKEAAHPRFFELMEALSWRGLEAAGFRDEERMIIVTNAFFLLVLFLSVYGIGSLLHGRSAGLLAALLVSMFPYVFAHSRVAMLDFPLMCMVSLSFFLLLKTGRFQSTYYSICAGIFFGIAQLTKETAIFFVFPALVYYFADSYVTSGFKKKVILNFFLALGLFIVVAGSVYLRVKNQHVFTTYFAKLAIHGNATHSFYFKNFIDCVGPFVLFLTLPLCLNYLINLRKREKFFFFWFFVPLALLTFSPNRAVRFMLPMLPAFSLIVTQEIFRDDLLQKFKRTCSFLLVFAAILQYVLFNYGVLDYSRGDKKRIALETGILRVQKEEYLPVLFAMQDVFKKEMPAFDGFDRILFLCNIGELYAPLRLQLRLSRLPYFVFCPLEADAVDIRHQQSTDWCEQVLAVGYIVEKPGDMSGIREHNYKIAQDLRECFAQHKNRFKVIAEIKAPDGSVIYIHKKIAR